DAASGSRSATAGASPSRGGASRSSATTSRWSGSGGLPSSTWTWSTGRGTSSGCTTDPTLARRPDNHRDGEQDQEQPYDEDEWAEVSRSRDLHRALPQQVIGPSRSTPA